MKNQNNCLNSLSSHPIVHFINHSFINRLSTLADKIDIVLGMLQEDQVAQYYSGSINYNLTEIIDGLNGITILQPIVPNGQPIDAAYANNFALKTPSPPIGQGLILLGDCGCKSDISLSKIKNTPIGDQIPKSYTSFLCCLATLLRTFVCFISTQSHIL